MDKKVWITLIIVAVLILAGFAVYKYSARPAENANTQNSAGGAETEVPPDNNQDIPEISDVQIQTENGGESGGLIVCVDKCGDNVCQKTDPSCQPNSMNCVCPETSQDCPQDCK
jgi:hypothetical protein